MFPSLGCLSYSVNLSPLLSKPVFLQSVKMISERKIAGWESLSDKVSSVYIKHANERSP